MDLNDKPCGTCTHFDPIIRGTKKTNMAWCAKRSTYPLHEGPGQIFPLGVTRSEVPQPKIVRVLDIVANCPHWTKAKPKLTKEELLKCQK